MGKLQDAIDFDEMTDAVTLALYESCRPDGEGWDDLDSDTKAGLRESAVIATKAAFDWLREKGVVFVPPGAYKHPTSREEAEHMMAAGMAWLKQNPAPVVVSKPKLIIPHA